MGIRTAPNTIEELLKSRNKHPMITLAYGKDVARRIKAIEKKLGLKPNILASLRKNGFKHIKPIKGIKFGTIKVYMDKKTKNKNNLAKGD